MPDKFGIVNLPKLIAQFLGEPEPYRWYAMFRNPIKTNISKDTVEDVENPYNPAEV